MIRDPENRTDWKFMMPLVLGTMMNPLNSTMLATALVTICLHFSENVSAGALLITPLYISAAIGQPLMGRLADIYDPKAINRFGILLVLLGAIIGMFATSFAWLIVARILFGLGTSSAYPSAMALIAHKYGNASRSIPANILGIITVASQVSLVLGPLLGGILTQFFGWQGIFLINLPWALGTLLLLRNIAPVKKPNDTQISVFQKTDAPGIVLFAAFLIFLLIALTQHSSTWLYAGLSMMSFVLFVLWERKQDRPFIDIKLLWYKPSLMLVYLRTLATNYTLYLFLYAMPQWIEAVKAIPPAQTGLIMLPMSLLSAISAIMLARRIKSVSMQNGLGVFSLIAACICLFILNQSTSVLWIICANMIAGVSIGVNIIAVQTALSAEAPPGQTGVSFGLNRTFGYMGAIISGLHLKAVFHKGITDLSLHQCGWFASVSCLILIALLAIRTKPAKAAPGN